VSEPDPLAGSSDAPLDDPLDDWVRVVADDLQLDPDAVDIALLLDVARDAAHGVVRPAAPVTTYLLGLAQGQRHGDRAELRVLAGRISALLAARPGADAGPDVPEED